MKPEINVTANQAVRTDVLRHISEKTVVRPSIVRKSVLPTINQGTTVLKTIYGGTTRSVGQTGATVQYNQNINVVNVNQQQQVGVGVNKVGVLSGAVPNPTISTYRGVGFQQTGSIMGVGGGIGDNAADITYSTRPGGQVLGTTGINKTVVTTTQTQTTPNIIGTGSVMGVGGGIGNNAPDVTYTTRPGAQVLGTTGINKTVVTTTQTTPNVVGIGSGSVMGVGGGIGDNAVDITYSTNPRMQNMVLGPPNKTIIAPGISTSVIGANNVVGFNGGFGNNNITTGPVVQGLPLGVNGINTPIVNKI